MKNLFISFVAVLAALTLVSFTNAINHQAEEHEGLGNVMYSMLPPEQFQKQNGDGWVLMDCRNIERSGLHGFLQDEGLTGMLMNGNQLPDARGVFIRNMGYQDTLSNDNQNRKMGSFQRFETGIHRKPGKFNTSKDGGFSKKIEISIRDDYMAHFSRYSNLGDAKRQTVTPLLGIRNAWGSNGNITAYGVENMYYRTETVNETISVGDHRHSVDLAKLTEIFGSETRPSNIALYLYVKINP